MENIQKMKDLLDQNKETFEKFFVKGRANAGTGVRKLMAEMIALAKEVRKDVSDRKNAAKSPTSN